MHFEGWTALSVFDQKKEKESDTATKLSRQGKETLSHSMEPRMKSSVLTNYIVPRQLKNPRHRFIEGVTPFTAHGAGSPDFNQTVRRWSHTGLCRVGEVASRYFSVW